MSGSVEITACLPQTFLTGIHRKQSDLQHVQYVPHMYRTRNCKFLQNRILTAVHAVHSGIFCSVSLKHVHCVLNKFVLETCVHGIWRWGLWELIRIWMGVEGGHPHNDSISSFLRGAGDTSSTLALACSLFHVMLSTLL